MAAELEKFLIAQLASLPLNHPDQRFLTGILQTTQGYREKNIPKSTHVSEHGIHVVNPLIQGIEVLDLNPRSINILNRLGIVRINQLIFIAPYLNKIPSVGEVTHTYVCHRLTDYQNTLNDVEKRMSAPYQERIEKFASLGWTLNARRLLTREGIVTPQDLRDIKLETLFKSKSIIELRGNLYDEISRVKMNLENSSI